MSDALPEDAEYLSQRLSRALGRPFVPDEAGNPTTTLMNDAVAQAYAKRVSGFGLPAKAQGAKVVVELEGLRAAIARAGGSDAFFDKLDEDVKTTQTAAQPIDQRDESQPADPKLKLRDQQEEIAALAEGLEQQGAAVKFREGLMERIELQQKYEPGFNRAKAMVDADRLIRAVNKGHEAAQKSAKKREEVAQARVEQKTPEQEALQKALEQERYRAEREAESKEREARNFVRSNAPVVLSGAMMEAGIARAMETLNLREPSAFAQPAEPSVAMVPMLARGQQQGLAA